MARDDANGFNRFAYAAYAAFAVLFLVLHFSVGSFFLSSVVKALPVAMLLTLTLVMKRGFSRTVLSLGLFFSLAGDVLLDVDRSRFFIHGLAGFLIAHLFYTVLFLKGSRFRKEALPSMIAVAAYAALLARLLRGMDPGYAVPVMGYLAVIAVMAASASVYSAANRWKGAKLVVFGAWLFMISDTVIAVNKFLVPIPYSLLINLPLYWCAQALIVRGIHLSD